MKDIKKKKLVKVVRELAKTSNNECIKDILERIKVAASEGKFHLRVKKEELSKTQRKMLELNGFDYTRKIKRDYSGCGWLDSESWKVVGYKIKWD